MKARAIVVLIASFLLGLLIGVAGYHYFRPAKYANPPFEGRWEGGPPPERRRLPEILEMTSEQEERFEVIMQESRRRLDALRVEQRAKIDVVMEETNQNLRAILNESQKMKLEAFLEDVRKQRGWGEPRGSGPPGPPPREFRGGGPHERHQSK